MSTPFDRLRQSGNQAGFLILRQLFIDAICGVEIPGRWFERLEEMGLVFFYAPAETWVWSRKAIEELDDTKLYSLYTQMRHGTSDEFSKIFASA